MRFQVNGGGWPIGGTLNPASTVIDLNKPDHELTTFERTAKDRGLPIDCTPLDCDAAVALWREYPWHRERLHLHHLDEVQRAAFERLLGMDESTLQRHWGR